MSLPNGKKNNKKIKDKSIKSSGILPAILRLPAKAASAVTAGFCKVKSEIKANRMPIQPKNFIRAALIILLLMLWDAVSVAVAVIIGFGMHYGFGQIYSSGHAAQSVIAFLEQYIILSVIVMLSCTIVCGCYRGIWKRAGVADFLRVILAVAVATAIMAFIVTGKQLPLPPEYIAVVATFELLFVLFARAVIHFIYWARLRIAMQLRRNRMKRVLIYGAGQAGADLAGRLSSLAQRERRPICFIDDDPALFDKNVAGLRVVGGFDKLASAISDYGIDEVIFAITSADSEMLKKLLMICHTAHCALKRYGAIDDISEKSLVVAPISNVNLEDLLKRDSVTLNMTVIKGFIEGKTILVTGGAGSIGSEICRQALTLGASRVVVFDISESGLFDVQNALSGRFSQDRFVLRLGSIRDADRVNEMFETFKPQVVFHAAAHKHVPMMEFNPREAIKNNVFGTINVASAAARFHAEKFILISTDKAVNPTNIMGASKRIAELAVGLYNGVGNTEFAAVRFGNVLGSSGSVVPFFKKQIEAGGPVTVTDPEVRRYFMTIPEAVQLVLEAGAMAGGGEIFVLDMGAPVRIYDLACDLIRLSGFDPEKDIKIIFTGLRPGEKLFEELSLAEEDVTKTTNDKIYICRPVEQEEERLKTLLKELNGKLRGEDDQSVYDCVARLVPTFSDIPRV